jgi:hypothetical protein
MAIIAICLLASLTTSPAQGQQSSLPTWEAAGFRIWAFIPYWAPQTQIDNFATNGMYRHVSDLLYFGGVRPDAAGNLVITSHAATALPKLQSHAAAHGFNLHLSLKTVSGSSEDSVWESIVSNAAYRANLVNNVSNILTTYNMKGINLDWERPNTTNEWRDYTQLAKELRTAINPLGMEVSVDDYGSTDTRWDDTTTFDARIYDQIFIMIYHLGASAVNTYSNQKLALTQQGAEKAFTNEQIAIGVGTWGTGGPATVPLSTFVQYHPDLGYDVTTISGTYPDLNGVMRTGTWTIESRKQVREKTQVALDRNQAGMFTWTLHYDASNQLGLHRAMHHYIAFQRAIPDLNLDGKLNASDANRLADNMGLVLTNTGTSTAAQMDDFYLRGNWEQGDRNGDGFVNQSDADWLAGRFTEFSVALPDRLAYTGTFENFGSSRGLSGRWRAWRDAGNLRETGNYAQHGSGHLSWSGVGIGADKFSDVAVTIRNQNAAEAAASINTLDRIMIADLSVPIDLGQSTVSYFTFLVRQNTANLTASQLASPDRTLSLEFLDNAGVSQFDITFRGAQQTFGIQSQADAAGQDVFASGFTADTTYLFVGKIAGNGTDTNTMQATLFSSGSTVGNFTSPDFSWTLTAESSIGFNPIISQLRFRSLFEGSHTVSNVWIGTAPELFPPQMLGDFNADGVVDGADYLVFRRLAGQSGTDLPADADGDHVVGEKDYAIWRANFGQATASGPAPGGVHGNATPEPSTSGIVVVAAMLLFCSRLGCRLLV